MGKTRFRASNVYANGFGIINSSGTETEVLTVDKDLQNVRDIKVSGEINNRAFFNIFDDFLYQTIVEADTPWILNSGTDGAALDPAINAQAFGVARFAGGAGDGTVAQDGSQLVCSIPMKLADVGTLVMETRLKIDTAITLAKIFVGFTDVTTLEMPFSIATATLTSVATDAAGFLYDVGATAKTWHALSVANDVDSTGNVNTAIAPKITYQTLRVEVEGDASAVRFYVDGTLVSTLTASAPRTSVNLYATVAVSTSGTARNVDVDYVYIGHDR